MSIDDDPDIRRLIEQILINNNYEVVAAENGKKALQIIHTLKPDLILLDVLMPDMDGYETCYRLQQNTETAYIPVLFLTGIEEEQNKAKAFAAGAVDYIVKPFKRKLLLEKIKQHINTKTRWKTVEKGIVPEQEGKITPSDFIQFKEFLAEELGFSSDIKDRLMHTIPSQIYSMLSDSGIPSSQVAQLIAKFFRFRYTPIIDPDDVNLGILSTPFSKSNSVVAVKSETMDNTYVLSNPFNWELLAVLKKNSRSKQIDIVITEPENIASLLKYGTTAADQMIDKLEEKIKIARPASEKKSLITEEETEKRPVVHITNTILYTAVTSKASDIHIEPKEKHTIVRFRIDGDMRDMFSLNKDTGIMVLTRLKALGGLDITERHKPQDGSLEAIINNRSFKLRLASTSTPSGESLIIRMLEPDAKQKDLKELGMMDQQFETMHDFAGRTKGMVLVVGPTGSGKTTTIYSLLSQIDCQKRSLISVEDPVEYRITFANQQQVDDKKGVTFEAILKSSVRQDPDILFIGEVRDSYSASIAVDFASTGHLAITTLHTSNATTAIFRLERLGISRGQMADSILGIVAQRLLKKLCPYCKEIVPISDEEADMLAPFTDQLPVEVAHPVGCPKCSETGYAGREGVYEIIPFEPETIEMVRANKSIVEIREYVAKTGVKLISHHAVEKVKEFLFSPQAVYEKILVEEQLLQTQQSTQMADKIPDIPVIEQISVLVKTDSEKISMLVVEDDMDTQRLITRYLQGEGYDVRVANDGIDALMQLAQKNFNLILSDIQMPNLDGFKFMELKQQKGIETPLIFITSQDSDEDEIKGFKLGATDFIKKPVKKDVLLLRIKKALKGI
ncbi:MAG: ATPase, T2SS/T4P/T4SS family [Proteobacteria bacterium]|nr:ATPase, T2SS/T4P/T4SS family [Pseudomonadota bacterium]